MSVKETIQLDFRWFSIWLLLILVSGCGRKSDDAKDSGTNLHPEIQTTAELRRRLVPGMPTNEIIASFGKPLWVEGLGEGRTDWQYGLSGFPADDAMRGTLVVGFNAEITNGHLAWWGCTYMHDPTGENARMLPIGKTNAGSQEEPPVLKVFIVSDKPLVNGRQIDTPQFPKLGFISGAPSLGIKRVKEVTLRENVVPQADNNSSTNWQFGVSLIPDDATGLASLTASNVGSKILMMVGDVPVIAPVIRAPLENGKFVIDCDQRLMMETVKSNLTRMEQVP